MRIASTNYIISSTFHRSPLLTPPQLNCIPILPNMYNRYLILHSVHIARKGCNSMPGCCTRRRWTENTVSTSAVAIVYHQTTASATWKSHKFSICTTHPLFAIRMSCPHRRLWVHETYTGSQQEELLGDILRFRPRWDVGVMHIRPWLVSSSQTCVICSNGTQSSMRYHPLLRLWLMMMMKWWAGILHKEIHEDSISHWGNIYINFTWHNWHCYFIAKQKI